MSVDQLAHKRDASKLPTTAKVKPSVYISPEVVREIFEGVSPQVGGRGNPFAETSVTVPRKVRNRDSDAFTEDEARRSCERLGEVL